MDESSGGDTDQPQLHKLYSWLETELGHGVSGSKHPRSGEQMSSHSAVHSRQRRASPGRESIRSPTVCVYTQCCEMQRANGQGGALS